MTTLPSVEKEKMLPQCVEVIKAEGMRATQVDFMSKKRIRMPQKSRIIPGKAL
jgi:hypothetical protein